MFSYISEESGKKNRNILVEKHILIIDTGAAFSSAELQSTARCCLRKGKAII